MAEYIAGVDVVGRGPLVGDVVTAAVILDPAKPIAGLAICCRSDREGGWTACRNLCSLDSR